MSVAYKENKAIDVAKKYLTEFNITNQKRIDDSSDIFYCLKNRDCYIGFLDDVFWQDEYQLLKEALIEAFDMDCTFERFASSPDKKFIANKCMVDIARNHKMRDDFIDIVVNVWLFFFDEKAVQVVCSSKEIKYIKETETEIGQLEKDLFDPKAYINQKKHDMAIYKLYLDRIDKLMKFDSDNSLVLLCKSKLTELQVTISRKKEEYELKSNKISSKKNSKKANKSLLSRFSEVVNEADNATSSSPPMTADQIAAFFQDDDKIEYTKDDEIEYIEIDGSNKEYRRERLKKRKKIIRAILISIVVLCMILSGVFGIYAIKPEVLFGDSKIVYYLDENATERLTEAVVYGQNYDIDIPVKTGYKFLGLYDAAENGTLYVDAQGKSISKWTDYKKNSSVVLYAHWEAITYIVTYDTSGGEGTELNSFECTYGTEINDLSRSVTRTGYTFLGWASSQETDAILYTDSEGVLLSGKSVLFDGAYTIPESGNTIVLYAKWQGNTYGVSFEVNGGENLSDNHATVTFGEICTMPIPSRTGYEFNGWCGDSSASNLLTNNAGTLLSGWSYTEEKTLYAKWSLAKYSITVTPNISAAGTISGNTEVEYTSSATLNATVNVGYTFDGWYVNGNKQSSSLSYSFVMPATDVSIQALWTANTYTVSLNANGGNVSQSSKIVTYGASYSFPNATRNGYVFDGWYTNTTGGNELTGSNWNIVSSSGSFTAYAHWVAISDITVSLTKKNCACDNGYNPTSQAGEDDDKARHNNFEMVKLVVSNATQASNGYYYIPDGNTLSLKLSVQRSTTGLPLNSGETAKQITDDSYAGSIYGTNISGSKIGYGAYYVKVTYTDGTTYEKNATNILSGKSSGSTINMNLSVDSSKTIKSVQVIIVYEILTNGSGFLGIWWNEYTNWQCSTTLNFTH